MRRCLTGQCPGQAGGQHVLTAGPGAQGRTGMASPRAAVILAPWCWVLYSAVERTANGNELDMTPVGVLYDLLLFNSSSFFDVS